MKQRALAEALQSGTLIFDGPMGTELYRRHVFTNRCFEELCLTDPDLIQGIHRDYWNAGADVLTTNTYGANRLALGRYGIDNRQAEILEKSVALARSVMEGETDRQGWIVGSIGPLGPMDRCETEPEALLIEQIEGLASGRVDAILFETASSRREVELYAFVMSRFPALPYILSCAILENGETVAGETAARMFAPLDLSIVEGSESPHAPIAWSMNCGSGPDGLLDSVEQVAGLINVPLIVMPNAGSPKEIDNRKIYLCSPEYLATYAERFVGLGAAAVGGCCGTTPDHIEAIAKAIKPLERGRRRIAPVPSAESLKEKPATPVGERSRLGRSLEQGRWITSVELVPPRGYDMSSIVEKSKRLHRCGVDAINIPDGPRASSRISPLVVAERIQREAKIEAILHFCSRDRNLIGMQADLLACAACEIRNILFVTGDPPKLGNYPDASGVFDTDAIGMAEYQRRMNGGVDIGGQELSPATQAVIGVGLDPTALDLNRELDRFRLKAESGAEFAITQPIFDPDALLRFLDEVQKYDVPILAGVWPLASYRNALFLQNEVPGVEISPSIISRMENAETREEQLAVGVEIARESVRRIADRVAGIQVSAPFGKVDTALDVIEGWNG